MSDMKSIISLPLIEQLERAGRHNHPYATLMMQARDEIGRLRGELATPDGFQRVPQSLLDATADEIEKLRADIDALQKTNLELCNPWQDISTAPPEGIEFIGWFVHESGRGAWEPRCRIGAHGGMQVYGRVDYDCDDWADYEGSWSWTHWRHQPAAPKE